MLTLIILQQTNYRTISLYTFIDVAEDLCNSSATSIFCNPKRDDPFESSLYSKSPEAVMQKLVYKDIPTEYILNLTALETLDVVVELE